MVLAYGAEPIVPCFMTGFKQVMTADDLLTGRAFPGKKIVIEGAGTLVLALGYHPNTALADALTEAGCACHVMGDSKQCGNLRDAIEVGYKAACEL